jgi:hypothetical protein
MIFVFHVRKNATTADFNREYEKLCPLSMSNSVVVITSVRISKDKAILQIHPHIYFIGG